MSGNAIPRFDETIHAPTRLRLCALLRPLDGAEFSTIASALDLSEATLSKTIRNLAELGHVRVRKGPSADRNDARRVTAVELTPQGRRAFDGHLAALRALVGE